MIKTILLVEDSDDDILLFKAALNKTGVHCSLQIARDGREALRYLLGDGPYADRERYPLPCLTLLDLKLPYVRGFEVLSQIRRHPPVRKLVVVVLTSSMEDADRDRAYELGVNSFLVKPSSIDKQQELVKRICDYWLDSNLIPDTELAACAA